MITFLLRLPRLGLFALCAGLALILTFIATVLLATATWAEDIDLGEDDDDDDPFCIV